MIMLRPSKDYIPVGNEMFQVFTHDIRSLGTICDNVKLQMMKKDTINCLF
jgi:hypothetical protein